MNIEVRALLDAWAAAYQKQVEAELRVTHWQLHANIPLPHELASDVVEARALAESLFTAVVSRWPTS